MSGGIFDGAADEGIFGLGDDPVKDTSGAGPAETLPATAGGTIGGSVRLAQQNLVAAGFNVGSTGVDDRWGPCTAQALRNYINARGEAQANYVFGTTMVARARSTTGACAARTTGTVAQQQVPGGNGGGIQYGNGNGNGNGNGGGVIQAGVFPTELLTQWWFWLAVAGVAGLGYVGIRYYQKRKDEEEAEVGGYGRWA
jgi:hypothetical protein